MLEIRNVTKVFNPGTVNEKVALNDFSLTLEEGDFVTVIGGNGAGKSTMMNAIAGVWPVDAGQILIDGVDVTKLSEHKRAKYLGRVFQDPMTGTAATMGIDENLALAKRRGKFRSLKGGTSKKEREENLKDAFALCENYQIFQNKKILIFDDIFTTGSTMQEMIKTFQNKGLKDLHVLITSCSKYNVS